MSKRKDRRPLSPEKLEIILTLYNAYVLELNIREMDLTRELPRDRDEWSPLVSWLHPTLHPERNACFVLKEKPDRLITIRLRGTTCYKSGSALRNPISLENVRTAYTESFPLSIL